MSVSATIAASQGPRLSVVARPPMITENAGIRLLSTSQVFVQDSAMGQLRCECEKGPEDDRMRECCPESLMVPARSKTSEDETGRA